MKQYALSQMTLFEGVFLFLKSYVKLLKLLSGVCCLVLSLSFIYLPFVTYAGVYDLMIASASNATASNALMTLDLYDDDYSVSPTSSIASITNTVDWSDMTVAVIGVFKNDKGQTHSIHASHSFEDGLEFSITESLDGYYLAYGSIEFRNQLGSVLPPNGSYSTSFDFASDFSFDVGSVVLYMDKYTNNASTIREYEVLQFSASSGDFYVNPFVFNITNDSIVYMRVSPRDTNLKSFGGLFKASFVPVSSSTSGVTTPGPDTGAFDYESGVSSSLSDLSSSVGEMTEEISGVTQAIQNLQGAMEPHYNNVLTQLHHITEQLHAFWDQQFNLHHVPLMAKLDEIKSAIANMDLEVVVELDELKQTVNNMSQAIQNKLQSIQDTLTGGYNTGGIDSDQGKLEDSLTEYEEAEKNVIDKVNDSLNDFEFDSGFEEYSNTISTISDFLQALYDSSGGFKVVINLSLMLSLASLVIGFYRFKG